MNVLDDLELELKLAFNLSRHFVVIVLFSSSNKAKLEKSNLSSTSQISAR